MAQKFAHAELIIRGDKILDFLEFAERIGALKNSVHVRPVRHGGESESEGSAPALQPAVTSAQLVNDYVAKHSRIAVLDIVALGKPHGITSSAIYAQIGKLKNEKLLKRVDKGMYQRTAKGEKAAPPRVHTTNPAPGESLAEKVVDFIRGKQNGSGEGVAITDIKTAVVADGFAPTSVNTVMTKLLENEKVKRVATGMYRAP